MAIDPIVGASEMAVHNPHNLAHSRAFHFTIELKYLD
jgi:hypothetical protein